MAREENVLSLLEQGRIDAQHTEAARQARYKGEDAERIRVRAEEDRAYAQGDVDRKAVEAEMQAAIASRGMTPEAKIASLSAKVAHLEELAAPKGTASDPQPATVAPDKAPVG